MRKIERNPVLYGLLGLLLLCTAALSLRFGSTYLSTEAFWGGLFCLETFQTERIILYSIRFPRLASAVLAGAGLSLSGTLLQRATDNALAAPNILGINAGGGFFVILSLSFFPSAFALRPFAAFVGAFLTALVILLLADRVGFGKSAIILVGVALSALFQAGISFFSVLDSDVLASYTDFSVGGLTGVTFRQLYIPLLLIVLCYVLAFLLSTRLQLFCLGDQLAASLGVSVARTRMLALLLAAVSAAAVVSFAGLLGFVGLIVPHMARKLAANRVRAELVLSPLLGSILLLSADLLGRLLFAPSEIPVGIFTALLGVPFFISLIARRKYHA